MEPRSPSGLRKVIISGWIEASFVVIFAAAYILPVYIDILRTGPVYFSMLGVCRSYQLEFWF